MRTMMYPERETRMRSRARETTLRCDSCRGFCSRVSCRRSLSHSLLFSLNKCSVLFPLSCWSFFFSLFLSYSAGNRNERKIYISMSSCSPLCVFVSMFSMKNGRQKRSSALFSLPLCGIVCLCVCMHCTVVQQRIFRIT